MTNYYAMIDMDGCVWGTGINEFEAKKEAWQMVKEWKKYYDPFSNIDYYQIECFQCSKILYNVVNDLYGGDPEELAKYGKIIKRNNYATFIWHSKKDNIIQIYKYNENKSELEYIINEMTKIT